MTKPSPPRPRPLSERPPFPASPLLRRTAKPTPSSPGNTCRLRRVELVPAIDQLEIAPGDIVAKRYRVAAITERHADGGLTVSARHEGFDLPVELRLVGQHQADAYVAGKMQRRAQAVAQLDTRHVARVLDAGILDDGGMFVAYERTSGDSLVQRARAAGGLDLQDIISVFVQVADVMQEAHARGIVLGDLRPEDLMAFAPESGSLRAKIVELGSCLITRGVNVAGGRTRLSPWTAPERVRSSTTPDFASDIWSLGCLLFELISGRRPFRGSGPKLMLSIGRDDVPDPSSLRANPSEESIPSLLDDLACWALEKDPAKRPPTVHALVRHLSPWADEATRAILDRIAELGANASEPRYVLDHGSDPDPTDVLVGELRANAETEADDDRDAPPISGVYVTTNPLVRSARRQFLSQRTAS